MFDFAIDMEEEITRQLENLAKDAEPEVAQILHHILEPQKEFGEILKRAAAVNSDLAGYSSLDLELEKLCGADNVLSQVFGDKKTGPQKIQKVICALWLAQALLEKSAQYYVQAANNSQHPALKLFMKSLSQAKNIQKIRLAGCVRMAYNDVWEKVGFAPFNLGKD